MGPRSAERGICSGVIGEGRMKKASMGPRSAERGISVSPRVSLYVVKLLQWGLAQLSEELGMRYLTGDGVEKLQWGLAQLSEEFCSCARLTSTHLMASMGPRSAERGIAF